MDGKRTSRTFYKNFKVNAVKFVLEGSRSMAKIAEELGMPSGKGGMMMGEMGRGMHRSMMKGLRQANQI